MSGINRLIAEARGWQFVYDYPGNEKVSQKYWMCRIIDPDGIEKNNPWDNYPTEWFGRSDIIRILPDYEHDLNAAWPLLADIPDSGITHHDVSWFIDGHGAEFMPLDSPSPEHAATAICKAWLQWKGITIPEVNDDSA